MTAHRRGNKGGDKSALGDMKSGKAQGTDTCSITADLLKADTDTTVNTLHGLLQQQQQQPFICTHTTYKITTNIVKLVQSTAAAFNKLVW